MKAFDNKTKPINYPYALGILGAQVDSELFWRQKLTELGYDTWELPENLIRDIDDIGHKAKENAEAESREL